MSTIMKPDDTEPQVGALLRMAWEALQAELYVELRAAGFDDLREVHRPLLRYPPIDGMRPTDLAAHLKLSKQATNDLLRDLENRGYLRTERDPSDGRAAMGRDHRTATLRRVPCDSTRDRRPDRQTLTTPHLRSAR
jgi:hypothetical protein